MQKALKYTIFKTKWGYFGLAGTEYGLLRTHLPGPEPEKIKPQLLKNLQAAQFDKTFFKTTQQQIAAYFDGACVNFSADIPIVLDGFSPFACRLLTVCRGVRYGRTISYSGLARKAGSLSATRAVGRVMAKNPLPLIIPCHRIIYANGQIGGFSAVGGVKLKERMLQFEQRAPSFPK